MTPQINHLEKLSTLLRVSTHIYRVCMEKDGNTFIFRVHLDVTPQIDCLRKTVPVMRVSTHIYGVFDEIHGKTFIFRVNLGM